jgi:hypothetical protein
MESCLRGRMLGCQGGYWQMGSAHSSPGLPLTVVGARAWSSHLYSHAVCQQ